MTVQELVLEELGRQFDKMKELEVGSEDYKEVIEVTNKLLEKAIDMEKFEVEQQVKLDSVKYDAKNRLAQRAIEAIDHGSLLAVSVWGTLKSFAFEEHGTVTTMMGRGWINSLLPKKRS